MQVDFPNILKTPLDIYEAAKTVFPEVRAEITLDQDTSIKIKLMLQEGESSVTLEKCVNTQLFLSSMRRAVGQQYLQDNLVEYNPKKIFSIDPARFTVLEELSDWQSFRRAIYGQKKDA